VVGGVSIVVAFGVLGKIGRKEISSWHLDTWNITGLTVWTLSIFGIGNTTGNPSTSEEFLD